MRIVLSLGYTYFVSAQGIVGRVMNAQYYYCYYSTSRPMCFRASVREVFVLFCFVVVFLSLVRYVSYGQKGRGWCTYQG